MAITRRHILYDIWLEEKDKERLAYIDDWPAILQTAATKGGATIIGQQFHQFEPWGITGFILLAESHISIHTWPEENLASIDIFSCGNMDIEVIVACLQETLKPKIEDIQEIKRGEMEMRNEK